MSPGLLNAAGVVLGIVGTVVALVLLGGGLNGTEPLAASRSAEAVTVSALQMLGGGAALGGVLLAGRVVSPWAPLSSGLLWALGSLVTLADPTIATGEAAATLSGHQLGLGLAALMLLGAVALRPGRTVPARQDVPAQRRTDRDLSPVVPIAMARPGPRRPDGPGPRHRAAPRVPVPAMYPRPPIPRARRRSG